MGDGIDPLLILEGGGGEDDHAVLLDQLLAQLAGVLKVYRSEITL